MRVSSLSSIIFLSVVYTGKSAALSSSSLTFTSIFFKTFYYCSSSKILFLLFYFSVLKVPLALFDIFNIYTDSSIWSIIKIIFLFKSLNRFLFVSLNFLPTNVNSYIILHQYLLAVYLWIQANVFFKKTSLLYKYFILIYQYLCFNTGHLVWYIL